MKILDKVNYKGLASKKARYFVIGLLLFLLCFIAIVDRNGPIGPLFSYLFVYLFGLLYLLPLGIGCALGIYYVVRRRHFEFKIASYIIAFCFAIFFVLVLLGNNDATITEIFPAYGAHFTIVEGRGLIELNEAGVGGGIIGFAIYALLANLTNPLIASIIAYIGLVISILFLFRPLIYWVVQKIVKKAKEISQEKEKKDTTKTKETPLYANTETIADEQEEKRINEVLSKIKVIDSADMSQESRQSLNEHDDFFNRLNNNSNDEVARSDTYQGKKQTFNVFKDEIIDEKEKPVERKVDIRGAIEGFNVFKDSLFDDLSPIEQHIQEDSPTVKNVYDISDDDLLEERKRADVRKEPPLIVPKEEPKELDFDIFRKDVSPKFEDDIEPQLEEIEFEPEEEVQEEIKEVEEPVMPKKIKRPYRLPPASLLNEITYTDVSENKTEAELKIVLLNAKLASLGIKAKVHDYKVAPAFTRFEIEVSSEVKINMFGNVKNDLMMALSATNIDVLTPIPGTNYVGIDVPNVKRSSVYFKETYVGLPFELKDNKLVFAAGKDIVGKVVGVQIDKAPHLLVAGATGTGKSACLNTIIVSLLMRATPEEVKIMLIDPKKVEFSSYANIPHLLCPVIIDAKQATIALDRLCKVMDDRFTLFSESGKKNIAFYNNYCRSIGKDPLPYIVVIIDELNDLMQIAGGNVEESIRRITALARAAGIHLIVATQRPSVDVITGVIKSNIPSRIAFMVSSYQDSRTILDDGGAENLLGAGDMLIHMSGNLTTQRVQGAWLTDEEIEKVVAYCSEQRDPEFDEEFLNLEPPEVDLSYNPEANFMGDDDDEGGIYTKILQWLPSQETVSASYLVRKFKIGHPRAARMLDKLEEDGYISGPNGSKPREVYRNRFLANDEDF